MATAAEGKYEGGAGGKFRKRPFRRAATPYDRPVTALRNPVEAGRNGWISKLVDPASRIITRSAQRFFTSVFRRSLPAPQTPSEANHESRNEFPEAVSINPSFGAQERVSNGSDNVSNSSDSAGINELEQILKQKTFTRAEIDRLTELLHSRTVDVPAIDEKKSSEPRMPQLVADNHGWEPASIPAQENGVEDRRLLGGISAPGVSSSVLEEDVASPAELAKAYMGSRPSKVSPSTLGLRSQVLREDAPLRSNVPFPRKSPSMELAPRSSVHFTGVSENGYLTPRSRGRSAIYSMVRTPYSRMHPTATFKGVGSTVDGSAGPSTSRLAWENDTLSGGKQVSKRRSSVLDNDIGSIGPIRRIRQKTNLMSPKSMGLAVPAVGSDAAQGPVSSIQKPLLLEGPKHNIPYLRFADNGDSSVSSKSLASVPSQSSEMARKILQQLDKLVPSPKEKSSELKLAIAREKAPAKLTLSMLQGQALRSVEDVDSSKLLHNVQNTGDLDGVGGTHLPVGQDSTSQKLHKVEENGPLNIAGCGNKLAPEANGVKMSLLKTDAVTSFKTADSAISNFVANPPQKKRAFQMSAHEDYLELDDDSCSISDASTLLANEKEKPDTVVEERKAVAIETITEEKSPVSEIKPPVSFKLNKGIDMGASDRPLAAEKNIGVSVPATSAPSAITQPAMLSQSLPVFNSIISTKEPTAAPVFNFGSKVVDKALPFTSSSTSSFSESLGLKFSAQSDPKLETLSSPASLAAAATESALKAVESDKGDKDNALKAGASFRKQENTTLFGVSTPNTSMFSFNTSSNNSNLNNGSLTSSPSIFAVPTTSVPVSSSFTNQIFTSGPATTTANAIGSGLSTSAATPKISLAPVFQFGTSTSVAAAPLSSVSPPSTTGAESTDSEQKTKLASPFGSLTASPFGTTSSAAFTSTGSSIFGFSNSASASTTSSSSCASDQPQSSNPFGTGTESVFGSQAVAGTEVAPFTQSIPSHFGSPTFGLSSSSTSSSGSFQFGSSTPASKSFASSSGFGQSSSATFSTAVNSFSTASASTSLFVSSSQPAASSLFGPAFGSTSSPASGFSFEGSSAAVAASGSAPVVFGSGIGASSGSTGSTSSPATGFSFGGSSAAVAAASAPMVFGSGFGTTSGSLFSFTSTAATTSSSSLASSHPVFGASNPVITFGSASPSNDQMNMEDSMAEDTVQASTPVVPVFGQQAASSPSGFTFNSPPPSGLPSPFQFGAQPNQVAPQSASPFQGAGNIEFSAGGSFSLGTGGGDKSSRRFIRAKRDKMRKK